MLCLSCRTEYRDGFTRCADCSIELIPELSEPVPGGRSPEQLSQGSFLLWFSPLVTFYLLPLLTVANPRVFAYWPIKAAMLLAVLVAPIGSYWVIYQAIRYEQQVAKYVLYALIPFLFIWYYRERSLNRRGVQLR